MTLDSRPSPTDAPSEIRFSRRVSSMTLTFADDVGKESSESENRNALLARQVSHDGLISISDGENEKNMTECSSGRSSPVRCVSEFDKATEATRRRDENDLATIRENLPPFPNPLYSPKMLEQHTKALRLEADLQPMRLILSRIMAHPTLNRKGIFNVPVDPVALNLPDYFSVIEKPMDLGTIKVKLHAIAYQSRREVADDIRLVFANAMTYNPPQNIVHIAAKDLLAFFEDQVQAFVPELAMKKAPPSCTVVRPVAAPSSGKQVPRAEQEEVSSAETPKPFASPAHNLGTRNSASIDFDPATQVTRRRKKRGSRVNPGHACNRCQGRTCTICLQGCLGLEPTLLICNGVNCAGAKIRKGAFYFISKDGSRQYCQRCHTSLPAVLPSSGSEDGIRYKRDLLKRKNDEEVVERWLTCSVCESSVHQVCAMHDEFVHSEDTYKCPSCVVRNETSPRMDTESDDGRYTFLSGSEVPVKMSDLTSIPLDSDEYPPCAERLPETEVSSFIQEKVRECMKSPDCPNAEGTVHVRIISDCHRFFKVPDVVRKHFTMATSSSENGSTLPPTKVNYRSKAIALFQKVDGLDICIFCMYVHEYEGDEEFEDGGGTAQEKRVYIAYLDSVEHFRPRAKRTSVFHEILVSYLATARSRGFESAHIWSCPPSRGNSFVFWNHPASQRTPSRDRLVAWYHEALSYAVARGVVTDVKSLYESDFEEQLRDIGDDGPDFKMESRSGQITCPPLLDGDFWLEEASRIHAVYMARHMKAATGEGDVTSGISTPDVLSALCPARQLASLVRDKIMPAQCAAAFRRPVNAAAMKISDYHDIIKTPMDLGTIYSRCMLGEYDTLRNLVEDLELVVSNAQRYNPKGHVVHTNAEELRELFFAELNEVVKSWRSSIVEAGSWSSFGDTSLNLDVRLGGVEAKAGELAQNDPSMSMESDSKVEATQNDSSHPAAPGLLSGGPEAVQERMVGPDTWLLEKTTGPAAKGSGTGKKGGGKRRRSELDCDGEPSSKRRRQAWLGVEVGCAVRRMRTSFFTCTLRPKPSMSPEEESKLDSFQSYVSTFDASLDRVARTSNIANARHALLEFSQFRNLEFDTLRHAKYSTAVILYHLHYDCPVGIVPCCSSCRKEIQDVRWHRVGKIAEYRRGHPPKKPASQPPHPELCTSCYSTVSKKDQYIPLQVSLHATTPEEASSK